MDVTILLQHYNKWLPEGRNNADEVVVLQMNNDDLIQDLRKLYVAGAKKPDFTSMVLGLTADYHAMVIRNSSSGNKVDDICHWLRIPAEDLEQVTINGQKSVRFKNFIKVGNTVSRYLGDLHMKDKKQADNNHDESEEDDLDELHELEEVERKPIVVEDQYGRIIIRCLNAPKVKKD
jgi:hypothetical protein